MARDGVASAFAIACVVTLCGGVLMILTEMPAVPLAIGIVGLALFLAGTLLIATLAVYLSRATGQSLLRSAWSGVRITFRWFLFFLP